MNRTKILAAVGLLICTVAYVLVPAVATADSPFVSPVYSASVQRAEETSKAVDFSRTATAVCISDGGLALLTTPDGGKMSSELDYICLATPEIACIGNNTMASGSCARSFQVEAKKMFGPFSFYPAPDGGSPTIACITSGAQTTVTCTPVVGRIVRSR